MLQLRQSRTIVRLLLTVLASIYIITLSAQFAGGQGTQESPWQIATPTHLNNVRNYLGVDNVNRYFIQTANIDLGAAPWNQGAGWVAIGDNNNRFQGKYDGGEFVITGLTINNNSAYKGLFGYTSAATIKNVTLVDVDLRVGANSGALIGRADNTGIEFCSSSGTIISTDNIVGGLIGYYSGLINDSFSSVNVTSLNGDMIGGFIGDSWGRGNRCYATGTVRGRNFVGGFSGRDYNNHPAYQQCFATGNVTGNNQVGGMFGLIQTSTYWDLYAAGDVVGNDFVGGFVGYSAIVGATNRAYAVGSVRGNTNVGGLIGGQSNNPGAVNNSYWNTESSGQMVSTGGEGRTTAQMLQAATFGGWDFNNIWSSGFEGGETYPWFRFQGEPGDHNYPRLAPPANLFASISAEPRITLTWSSPSFGEADEYKIYKNDTFLVSLPPNVMTYADNNVNNMTTYSYQMTAMYGEEESVRSNAIRATPVPGGFPGGTGKINDPYHVVTATHLDYVRHNPTANYIQMENIDLVGINNWQPIGTVEGTARFTGSYNGNGYTISNLTINRTTISYVGLFGYAGTAGVSTKLSKIRLENVDITGRDYVGGLVGRIDGNSIIDSCYVFGDIESIGAANNLFVGGLVGYNSARITNSHSSGTVEANNSYVGGLIGYNLNGIVENSYTNSNVSGGSYVGGFVGYHSGTITNSFTRGTVTGAASEVGGFAAHTVTGNIRNCYSTGRISAPQDAENVGGFIGRHQTGTITNCYWDTQSSGQRDSPAGEDRVTDQMTHPYDPQTYAGWDFQNVWTADEGGRLNDGYPYLYWHLIITGTNPDIAANPQPQHQATNVSIDLESVQWTYTENILYTNPVGFRVYMNNTGNFGADDNFVWVPYIEEQENYSTGDVLPEELAFNTTYFWKVVPTTLDPNGRTGIHNRRMITQEERNTYHHYRGDAENVPVWRFTTEIIPYPATAANPSPADEALDVSVHLERLGWTYTVDQAHMNPVGFRVYFNTTGEFGEDDDFGWVNYVQNQSNYTTNIVLPDELNYAETYFWKVVPTTTAPGRESGLNEVKNRNRVVIRNSSDYSLTRGDAENVAIWSFSTILMNANPVIASNPEPAHLEVGVSPELEYLSWDYVVSEVNANPVGFRVYMNTSGGFGSNAPYVWVDYIEDVVTFTTSEILPGSLEPQTTYYWRIIPTTIHPDDLTLDYINESKNRKNNNRSYDSVMLRGDAENCPVWRFTTGETDVADDTILPSVNSLHRNYPNPFNPETTISYSLAEPGNVLLEIYNIQGRKIVTLVNQYKEAGNHNILWNGKDDRNREASSGIYFYKMRIGNYEAAHRMIMVK